MGEQQSYDTLYQVLDYPLPRFFALCLQMCRATREVISLSLTQVATYPNYEEQ